MTRTNQTTPPWDADFLRNHEQALRKARESKQFDDDRLISITMVRWDTSDSVDGYRECPLRACRRVRACQSRKPVCLVVGNRPLTPREYDAIDEAYADIQRERMAEATGEAEG